MYFCTRKTNLISDCLYSLYRNYSIYSPYRNYSIYSNYSRYRLYNNYQTKNKTMQNKDKLPSALRPQTNWENLHFYQKSDALYQLTFCFCRRFLPAYGDRTVDQMVQAARSGKQNIVEGLADGVTSTEMQLKLLNVARSSLQELREDYRDFLSSRALPLWGEGQQRYDKMLSFCRNHNKSSDYEPYFEKWTAEEMANTGLTLCHMTDAMLNRFIKMLDEQFVKEGGIKERMYAARTGYRKGIDDRMKDLEAENNRLKALLRQHGIPF